MLNEILMIEKTLHEVEDHFDEIEKTVLTVEKEIEKNEREIEEMEEDINKMENNFQELIGSEETGGGEEGVRQRQPLSDIAIICFLLTEV